MELEDECGDDAEDAEDAEDAALVPDTEGTKLGRTGYGGVDSSGVGSR